MALTIRWLMERQLGEQAFVCLAGEKGLDHGIHGINIMDNPDTVPWLKKDELVLSTGYIFTATNIYKNIIRDLYQQGCSGLGIKMHRYMDSIPEEMIEQANQLDFPIFSIPFSMTMEEIVNMVYYERFRNEISESERWVINYRSLMETALEHHKPLPALQKISEILKLPICITTPSLQLIEYAPATSEDSDRFLSMGENHYLFHESEQENLLQLLQDSKKPVLEHVIQEEEHVCHIYIYPIENKSQRSGYFMAITYNKQLRRKQNDMIMNMRSVIEIIFARSQLIYDHNQDYYDTFYQKLLSGSLKNTTEIELECRQYGFDYAGDRVCLLLQSDSYRKHTMSMRRAVVNKLVEVCQSLSARMSFSFHYTLYNGDFVAFLFPKMSQLPYAYDWLEEVGTELESRLQSIEEDWMIGFSRLSGGAATIHPSYIEAGRSIDLGRHLHPEQSLFYYHKDLIYHMLSSNMTSAQLYDYYDMALRRLDEYDEKNHTSLVDTLYTYLQCGQNLSQTSKKLFIHRNTMIYRMEQIKELLSLDLKNVDHRYLIQTAFYARKLL